MHKRPTLTVLGVNSNGFLIINCLSESQGAIRGLYHKDLTVLPTRKLYIRCPLPSDWYTSYWSPPLSTQTYITCWVVFLLESIGRRCYPFLQEKNNITALQNHPAIFEKWYSNCCPLVSHFEIRYTN